VAWYEDAVESLWLDRQDGQCRVHGVTGMDCVVQCYVSGRLIHWKRARGGQVRFDLPCLSGRESVALLGVDGEDRQRDFFREAFESVPADRIEVTVARRMAHPPGSLLRIRVGNPGQSVADRVVSSRPVHPGGSLPGGFGQDQAGSFGFDATATPGMDGAFGLGEMGFDAETLTWTSQPLGPGTYPVRLEIVDADGNASSPQEYQITLAGYAAPAQSPRIVSYEAPTDTLSLSWNPSEDLP
jgi:hypothetical protein